MKDTLKLQQTTRLDLAVLARIATRLKQPPSANPPCARPCGSAGPAFAMVRRIVTDAVAKTLALPVMHKVCASSKSESTFHGKYRRPVCENLRTELLGLKRYLKNCLPNSRRSWPAKKPCMRFCRARGSRIRT